MFDQTQVVPENVILYANKNGYTAILANLLRYKAVFTSGHFHSKTPPECLSVCRKTFHNHLKAFVDLGWAERLDGGFRLVSIYKISARLKNLHKDYKCTKRHKFTDGTKSDLVSALREVTLRRKHRQIDFMETAKRIGITKTRSDKRNKFTEKLIVNALSNNVSMSNKTIGRIWGMSSATGHRQKIRLLSEGHIDVTHQQPQLYQSNVPYVAWQHFKKSEDYNQTLFHSGTNIWQSQSDKIYCYV